VQMDRGVTFAVTLLAVALRAVLRVELLARVPLRLRADVRTCRSHELRRRSTQPGEQHDDRRARDRPAFHCFATSSFARGLRPVKS
jgi:hypothetical protein